jgi:hypothetical protein
MRAWEEAGTARRLAGLAGDAESSASPAGFGKGAPCSLCALPWIEPRLLAVTRALGEPENGPGALESEARRERGGFIAGMEHPGVAGMDPRWRHQRSGALAPSLHPPKGRQMMGLPTW